MPAPVYLVRHGQSEWNVLRLTQGQTAHPRLTEIGRRQAEEAARLIAEDVAVHGHPIRQVVSSDLVRARETADLIAARLDVQVVAEPRLREQHLGELQGKTYEETWAAAESHDWSDPTLPIAGGESLSAVRDRMVACLEELDPEVCHVVVSHGDAIRAAVSHVRNEPVHEASWVDVPNGSVACLGEDVCWLPAGSEEG